jgi:hypothetical protein
VNPSTLPSVAVLARVTDDLDAQRGPDLMYGIEVPADWFGAGARVLVRLPRFLPCARCEGGGCDRCERKGAFELALAGAPLTALVHLPRQSLEALVPVRLRLPDAGATDPSDATLPRGHLLLTVIAHPAGDAWSPGSHLSKLEEPSAPVAFRAWAKLGIWAVLLAIVSVLAWWFGASAFGS